MITCQAVTMHWSFNRKGLLIVLLKGFMQPAKSHEAAVTMEILLSRLHCGLMWDNFGRQALTYLVKAFLPPLSPLITNIIHSSLTTGQGPSPLKTSPIHLLKKPGTARATWIISVPYQIYYSFPNFLKKAIADQVHTYLSDINLWRIPIWFLLHSTQFVQFKTLKSCVTPLTSSVPQGSVLGSLLFIIFL